VGYTLVQKGAALVPGFALKYLVDAISLNNAAVPAGEKLRVCVKAAVMFFVFRILSSGCSYLRDFYYESMSLRVARSVSITLLTHLQHLSFSYHAASSAGVNYNIVNRGVSAVTLIMKTLVLQLVPTIIETVLVTWVFCAWMGSPLIALATATTVIAYIAFTGAITTRRIKLQRKVVSAQNNLSRHVVETLAAMETVKTFGMESQEVAREDELRSCVQRASNATKWAVAGYDSAQSMIMHFGITIGLVLAARDAAQGRITPGDFLMVQGLIGQLFAPLMWLGAAYGQIVDAFTNLEQVVDVYNIEQEVKDAPAALPVAKGNVSGEIVFDNVSFCYPGTDTGGHRGSVSNISFRVAPGTMTALVGESGAGKSSVTKLLLRLYDRDSGSITIDGVAIENMTQKSLRECIGVVAQETSMFDDTILNNARYGNAAASEDDVWEALRAAELEEFVLRQTQGLETTTGPRGVCLSGGERQRLGIAQCVLKKPSIIVLDEATRFVPVAPLSRFDGSA
jgi:ATP-binding cassette, subfamily B, heavy metal transporter